METSWTAIIVRGGLADAERVLRQCADENGGRLVGNPDIRDRAGVTIEGLGLVTVIIVEDDADPAHWWDDWNRVHGVKLPAAKASQ